MVPGSEHLLNGCLVNDPCQARNLNLGNSLTRGSRQSKATQRLTFKEFIKERYKDAGVWEKVRNREGQKANARMLYGAGHP